MCSIYKLHDEAKDKAFELEMSWICDESKREHQKVKFYMVFTYWQMISRNVAHKPYNWTHCRSLMIFWKKQRRQLKLRSRRWMLTKTECVEFRPVVMRRFVFLMYSELNFVLEGQLLQCLMNHWSLLSLLLSTVATITPLGELTFIRIDPGGYQLQRFRSVAPVNTKPTELRHYQWLRAPWTGVFSSRSEAEYTD